MRIALLAVERLKPVSSAENKGVLQHVQRDLVEEHKEVDQRKDLRLVRSYANDMLTSTAISTTGFQSVKVQTSTHYPEKQVYCVKHVSPHLAG